MQSSMWSNSSTAVTQYQQQLSQPQQQQQQQPHHSQQETPSTHKQHIDVCPHLKVMRRGVDMTEAASRQLPQEAASVWSPQTQQLPPPSPQPLPPPPQFTSRVTVLAPSASSSAAIDREDDAGVSATDANADAVDINRFPLLSITNSLRQTSLTAAQPKVAVPLATRQQRYLQQHRQQLLQQQQQLQQPNPSTGPMAEAALRLKLQRKRIRDRALILVYLSCMLLFVLAVVFLAALGVFYTAGSTAKAPASDARIAPSEQTATASIWKGASP